MISWTNIDYASFLTHSVLWFRKRIWKQLKQKAESVFTLTHKFLLQPSFNSKDPEETSYHLEQKTNYKFADSQISKTLFPLKSSIIHVTKQEMKFSIKDFFIKYDQIRRKNEFLQTFNEMCFVILIATFCAIYAMTDSS